MLRKRSLVLRSCDASSCTQEISEQKYRQSSQVSMKSEGTCSRTKKCGSSCPTAPRRSCINDLVCWESCHCNSAFVTSHALAQFASLLSMVTATHARVDQHYDVTKRNPLRNVTHLPRLRSTLVFQAVGVCCPTWERPVAKELTHYQRLSPTTPSRTFQERGGVLTLAETYSKRGNARCRLFPNNSGREISSPNKLQGAGGAASGNTNIKIMQQAAQHDDALSRLLPPTTCLKTLAKAAGQLIPGQ